MTAGASSIGSDASILHFLRPFAALIERDDVTEIAVNSPREIWFESNSLWQAMSDDAVTDLSIVNLGGAVATYSKQIWDAAKPLLSASMPDGSRMQFARSPAVESGRTSFTMRKPAKTTRSLDDFAAAGLFESVQAVQLELLGHEQHLKQLLAAKRYEEFFRQAVAHRLNIVVAGATGSGKTTFMKSLVTEIPKTERLITIEDVRELFVPHKNAVHLLYSKGGQSGSDVTPKSLLESCLRMKPDRILLAEVRGDECLYFVRNAASGHPGSMTSCHAGSPALAMEQMAIMIQDSPGGANLTFDVIKRLLTLTIDVIVQFQNVDGRRFISEIYYAPEKKLEASR